MLHVRKYLHKETGNGRCSPEDRLEDPFQGLGPVSREREGDRRQRGHHPGDPRDEGIELLLRGVPVAQDVPLAGPAALSRQDHPHRHIPDVDGVNLAFNVQRHQSLRDHQDLGPARRLAVVRAEAGGGVDNHSRQPVSRRVQNQVLHGGLRHQVRIVRKQRPEPARFGCQPSVGGKSNRRQRAGEDQPVHSGVPDGG